MVDDESRMRKLVNDFLSRKNYEVIEACDGEEAIDKFYGDKDISLVILDVMMPKMDGWEVCREIRKNSSVPIIMLTAKSEENDELTGFECGADEYISKPFSPKELIARINAILSRRKGSVAPPQQTLKFGGLEINIAARTVTVDGKKVDLTPKEYDLLFYLVENKNIALSRDKLLSDIWGYDFFGDDRTIDTHIKNLRNYNLHNNMHIHFYMYYVCAYPCLISSFCHARISAVLISHIFFFLKLRFISFS